MVNRKSIKVGDYLRWLYPLGYIDLASRRPSYGLVMDVKNEDDLDGRIVLLLDSVYRTTY